MFLQVTVLKQQQQKPIYPPKFVEQAVVLCSTEVIVKNGQASNHCDHRSVLVYQPEYERVQRLRAFMY